MSYAFIADSQQVLDVDVVVVGGGIAGLLTAYRLKKQRPSWRVVVFEQSSKPGGRAKSGTFSKHSVAAGAGVGRKHKDFALASLLQEMDFALIELPASQSASVRQHKSLNKLVHSATELTPENDVTFKAFGSRVLGDMQFESFVHGMGFTDMLQASALQTMRYYGLDDNIRSWSGFVVPWDALLAKLADSLGRTTVKQLLTSKASSGLVTNTRVVKLETSGCQLCESQSLVYVETHKAGTNRHACFSTTHVVLATPITSLKQLIPVRAAANSKLAFVKAQPFVRLYVKVAQSDRSSMQKAVQKFRVVSPSILMKVREINAAEGVYMLAYADNRNARQLKKHIEAKLSHSAKAGRLHLQKLLAEALQVQVRLTSFKMFWFDAGTHYYSKGLPEHFEKQMFVDLSRALNGSSTLVVGEAVAPMQGWTEGAIQSVNAVVAVVLQKHNN